MSCLYYYKLQSEFPCDVSKQCKLTINEIDSNFYQLKKDDISAATFVRGEDLSKSDGTLVITRNNGEKIIVPIDTTINKNLTYDFNSSAIIGDKGGTDLTLNYKDDEGEHTLTIKDVLTADNLIDIIGSDILTKVITDNTLRGLGTMKSPLGLASIEKTGMLAPAIKVIDLTDGSMLPIDAEKGTRYVTKEKVNDYGYLYNGSGVEKIQELLDLEYDVNEINKEVDDRKYYWRVPSKADWDKMLNSIEPCEYRNHHSAQCHVELGKVAGKYLKSECGWVGQPDCTCSGTRPYNGTCSPSNSVNNEGDDYVFDNGDVTPSENPINEDARGIDKYGMKILPAGSGYYKNGRSYQGFTESAYFWTTTKISVGQDTYVKEFDYNMGGVWQIAECPTPYYSVRLVKDYDGSNYRDSEYIDGILYKTILMPESGQIWLASNFADKNGFETEGTNAEVLPVNGGHVIETKTEMFINDYNGRYWEKKVMNEGDTIVIQNPDASQESATTINVCWIDEYDNEHCIEIDVPTSTHHNSEYRVFTNDDECNKDLMNTDNLVLQRVIEILGSIIEKEIWERKEADIVLQDEIDELSANTESAVTELWEALSAETSARTETDEILSGAIESEIEERMAADEVLSGAIDDLSANTESAVTGLWEALSAETDARIEGDLILDEKIDDEIDRATSAETALDEKIDEEISRAIERENEIDGQLINPSNTYELSAAVGEGSNLVLETKDDITEHFIKINMNSDFGEI